MGSQRVGHDWATEPNNPTAALGLHWRTMATPTASSCVGTLGNVSLGAASCRFSSDCASTRRNPYGAPSKCLNLWNFSFPKIVVSPLGNPGPFLMKATRTVLIKSALSQELTLIYWKTMAELPAQLRWNRQKYIYINSIWSLWLIIACFSLDHFLPTKYWAIH